MTSPRLRTVLAVALLAPLAWLLVGPQAIGGPVALVSTVGSSMAPAYEAGDLVVVVRAADYEVGDVVAYRSDQLDTTVLHRIVDVTDDGYVLQGDANDWLDPERPSDDQLLGTARFSIPRAGQLLDAPLATRVAAVGVVGLLLLAGRPRRRRPATTRRSPTWVGWPSRVATVGVVTAVLSASIAAVAFTSTVEAPGEVTSIHRGAFDYTTTVPPSIVYPDGRVATGDTVFLRLVDRLDLTFVHEVDAASVAPRSTVRLWVEVTDGTGWTHREPLTGETPSSDGRVELSTELDVPALRAVLTEAQEQTGVTGGTGTLTVLAEIETVVGVDGGASISDRSTSVAAFRLEAERLVPAEGSGAADAAAATTDAAGATGTTASDDPFSSKRVTTVAIAGAGTAQLELAGRHLAVPMARVVAVAGLVASLVALGVAAIAAWRRRDLDGADRLRLRYGRRFLEVTSLQVPEGRGLVEIADVAALVSIADAADRPILHHQLGCRHTYVVDDAVARYRYELDVDRGPTGPAEPEAPAPLVDDPGTTDRDVPAAGDDRCPLDTLPWDDEALLFTRPSPDTTTGPPLAADPAATGELVAIGARAPRR